MRKIDALIKEAREAAEWRGHNLYRFKHHNGYRVIASTECKDCGYYVGVNARPLPNEIEISGSAVALNCPKKTLDIS